MSATTTQEVLLTHWDNFDNFLDPESYDRILKANWPTTNTEGAEKVSEEAFAQLRNQNTPGQQGMVSQIPANYADNASEREEPPATTAKVKQVKGKDANKTKDLERRRGQIRLAQQAYRRRKEATINSLQDEVCRLRGVQGKMQQLFEQLHWQAVRLSVTNRDSDIAYQVETTTEEFSALVESCSTTICDRHQTSTPTIKLSTAPDTSPSGSQPAQQQAWPTRNSLHDVSNTTNLATTVPIDSFAKTQAFNADKIVYPLVHQPLIGELDPMAETTLSLAARLRHEGLKRGLGHITNIQSPYSLLSRIFKFSMFTKTRNEIILQIKYHLQQSTQAAYYEMTTGSFPDFTEQSWAPEVAMGWNLGQSSSDLSSVVGKSRILERFDSVPVETHADYVNPDGVQRYLEDKGLRINPASPCVTVQRPNTFLGGGLANLFQEFASCQEIILNTKTVLYALVDCCVCLNFGPGFRIADIDEAIRLLIVAFISGTGSY